jgi:hypothetical protein
MPEKPESGLWRGFKLEKVRASGGLGPEKEEGCRCLTPVGFGVWEVLGSEKAGFADLRFRAWWV